MKTKIITKITKWTFKAVVIITAPVFITLAAIDKNATIKGITEGRESYGSLKQFTK